MSAEEFRAEIIGADHPEGDVKITTLTGADLDKTFIGKFLGRFEGEYNRLGKIVELIPVITDPSGLWLATIHWGQTPDKPAQIGQERIAFSQVVEIIEIKAG